MAKGEALNNIFGKENWESISNADEVYDRSKKDYIGKEIFADKKPKQDEPRQEVQNNNAELQNTVSRLKEQVGRMEIRFSEEITKQNKTIQGVADKMNEIILNFNRLETMFKELEKKASAPRPKRTIMVEKEVDDDETESTSNPALDKPIDRTGVAPSSVSIEKMFNFSNKKF